MHIIQLYSSLNKLNDVTVRRICKQKNTVVETLLSGQSLSLRSACRKTHLYAINIAVSFIAVLSFFRNARSRHLQLQTRELFRAYSFLRSKSHAISLVLNAILRLRNCVQCLFNNLQSTTTSCYFTESYLQFTAVSTSSMDNIKDELLSTIYSLYV